MTKEEAINILIKDCDTNKISDGYHTFSELYDHRIALFRLVCSLLLETGYTTTRYMPWKSRKHSDGTEWDGWFIMGIGRAAGEQITYHLPMSKWDQCEVEELSIAPMYDGHTSTDVLNRISKIIEE